MSREKDVLAPLVDVHAHFLTDDYVAAGREAGIEHPDGMPGWPDWSISSQLSDMNRRGIGTALLSISSPGVHFGDDEAAADLATCVNDAASTYCRTHPDHLGFLAALPLPDVDAAIRETRRALALPGARGVIVESNAGGQYLGAPELEPVWDALEDRAAIILIHPTSPPGWQTTALGRPRPMIEFMFDSTRSVVDLVLAGVTARHPKLRVVMPHSGAVLPHLRDRVALFLDGFASESSMSVRDWDNALRHMWFDTAGTPLPRALGVLADVADPERIVYGSDSCWTPAALVDDQIQQLTRNTAPSGVTWREQAAANGERLVRGGDAPSPP